MTKKDFLNQLSSHLKNIPQNDYNEIIEHFTEYFDDAGPEKEAQICQELGNPADIAKEIIDTLGIKENKPEKDWTDWDDEEDSDKTSGWGKQTLTPISSINFLLYNMDINILTEDISYPTISYYDDDNLTIRQTNGKLEIIENKQEQENTSIFSLFLIGHLLEKRLTITLTLPQAAQLSTISGDDKNGDISLSKIQCTSISLNSYNGNINVAQIDNARADLKSKNGNIKLTNCQFDNSKLETKNANLNCLDCQLSNCQFINKNGNISTSQGSIRQAIFENKNGNVDIDHSKLSAKINIVNKNGIIDIKLTEDNLSHCQVQTQNKNGFINISRQVGKSFPTQAHLNLENKNGIISLQ